MISSGAALPITTLALGALVTLLAAGCGDLYSDPDRGMSPSATAFEAPAPQFDASAAVPRDFLSPCPESAVEGSACNQTGVTCEYGASPDQRCNTTLSCEPDASFGMRWMARPSVLCPSYACPGSAAAVGTIDGTPCTLPAADAATSDADELVCPLADGSCACTTGIDAAHKHARTWVCVKPASGCPSTRPLVGQTCAKPRLCDYGSCDFKRGMRMECDATEWISGGATCN